MQLYSIILIIITFLVLLLTIRELVRHYKNKNHEVKTENTKNHKVIETKTVKKGIVVDKLQEGSGIGATNGKRVTVDYRAFLSNGKEVDSSYEKGETFSFTMGRNEVIPGWEHGMIGMKVGEVRRFTIAPEHAYGKKGKGKVPPNETIIFEVSLLKMD